MQYESFPVSVLKEQSEDMAIMFEWFDRVGYNIDIEALHETFSDVDWQRYSQWAEAHDWSILETLKSA